MTTEQAGGNIFSSILPNAIAVITRPVDFYRQMAKKGGFAAPLVFMVACGVAGGLVKAILFAVGLGAGVGAGVALASIVIMPAFIAIGGFIGAAVVFVVWKILGSNEDYETAYRCMAYSGAITPITTLVQAVPYLGIIVSLAWGTYLIVCASTEVHGISAGKAWITFGIIAAILALISISAEWTGRMMTERGGFNQQMQKMGEQMNSGKMSSEDAGKMVGQFMKGLEDASKKKQ